MSEINIFKCHEGISFEGTSRIERFKHRNRICGQKCPFLHTEEIFYPGRVPNTRLKRLIFGILTIPGWIAAAAVTLSMLLAMLATLFMAGARMFASEQFTQQADFWIMVTLARGLLIGLVFWIIGLVFWIIACIAYGIERKLVPREPRPRTRKRH